MLQDTTKHEGLKHHYFFNGTITLNNMQFLQLQVNVTASEHRNPHSDNGKAENVCIWFGKF
jgi:hypothetical protein